VSANEFSPPPPGALAQFDEDFGDWKLKPVVTAGGTNYATLTINGVPSPVTDVSVSFGRMLPESFHDVVSAMLVGDDDDPGDNPMLLRRSEWTPEYQAWRDQLQAAGVVLFRPPRWLRLWQRRHEKAKAKRERMRSARYAARWEQAHLRGEK